MKLKNRHVDEVKQLCVELNTAARGEEDDNLLLGVLFQKRKQQQEPLITGAHHIALIHRGQKKPNT